jgi:hypothetical protein
MSSLAFIILFHFTPVIGDRLDVPAGPFDRVIVEERFAADMTAATVVPNWYGVPVVPSVPVKRNPPVWSIC